MNCSAAINLLRNQITSTQSKTLMAKMLYNSPCDVFINHRGIDTKRSVASLLYDRLLSVGIRPFLDNKNMKPGDKLFEKINRGMMTSKVDVTVFSPRYCQSYSCLYELALIMEKKKKKVIPIFCDVKPSELRVLDNGVCSPSELKRFNLALEEARNTVGLEFDSSKGNLSDVVTNAVEMVIESLLEIEEEEQLCTKNETKDQMLPHIYLS